jgi:hypothetical protein
MGDRVSPRSSIRAIRSDVDLKSYARTARPGRCSMCFAMKLHALAIAALLLAACSSADGPASEATSDPDAGTSPPIVGESTEPDGGGTGTGNGTGGGKDSGTSNGDASSQPDAPSGPVNAFTGAPAYVATLGPSARSNRHTPANPAGQPCMNCHDGSRGGVRQLLFAGTVYKDAAGKTPAPRVEIRVRDAQGNGLTAYSDNDGNFFLERGARAPLAVPARAGARDLEDTRIMNNLMSEGDCNSCHKTGSLPPLNVP